jgi:hypothetical protein
MQAPQPATIMRLTLTFGSADMQLTNWEVHGMPLCMRCTPSQDGPSLPALVRHIFAALVVEEPFCIVVADRVSALRTVRGCVLPRCASLCARVVMAGNADLAPHTWVCGSC